MNKEVKTNTYYCNNMINGKNNVKINTICCNQVYDGKQIINLDNMKREVVELKEQLDIKDANIENLNKQIISKNDTIENLQKELEDNEIKMKRNLTTKFVRFTPDPEIAYTHSVVDEEYVKMERITREDVLKMDLTKNNYLWTLCFDSNLKSSIQMLNCTYGPGMTIGGLDLLFKNPVVYLIDYIQLDVSSISKVIYFNDTTFLSGKVVKLGVDVNIIQLDWQDISLEDDVVSVAHLSTHIDTIRQDPLSGI